MTAKPTKPICPNCGYDLSGLIEPETTATCPECSTESSYQAATEMHSRWNAIKWVLILLWAIPMSITAYSFAIYTQWSYEDDLLFVIGFVPLGLAHYYMIAITAMLVYKEIKARRPLRHARKKPAGWVFIFFLLTSIACSLTISFMVLIQWASDLASV